jgi:hypothetical protein
MAAAAVQTTNKTQGKEALPVESDTPDAHCGLRHMGGNLVTSHRLAYDSFFFVPTTASAEPMSAWR